MRMLLTDIMHYMRALLTALKRLHSFRIIHRDLKPANFLHLPGTQHYHLVDLGLASVQQDALLDAPDGADDANPLSALASLAAEANSGYQQQRRLAGLRNPLQQQH